MRVIALRLLGVVGSGSALALLLMLVASFTHGHTVGAHRSMGSPDLDIGSPDALAVIVGLMLLATTINIALASLGAPTGPIEQIYANAWRKTLSGVAVAAAVFSLAVALCRFGAAHLSCTWPTAVLGVVVGLLGAAAAAAGSGRAEFESVRHLSQARLADRINTLQSALADVTGRVPRPARNSWLVLVDFAALILWLSLLASTVVIVWSGSGPGRTGWVEELVVVLLAGFMMFTLLLTRTWITTARATQQRLRSWLFTVGYVVFTVAPLAASLILAATHTAGYGAKLVVFTVVVVTLPLIVWRARRVVPPLFRSLDDLSATSMRSQLGLLLAQAADAGS